jgi:hypothetical protein
MIFFSSIAGYLLRRKNPVGVIFYKTFFGAAFQL